jgi:orotidine-5'-phosphate decarboxylase
MSAIPPTERLIVALDVPTPEQAQKLVEQLGQQVVFYKLGLELFMTPGFWPLLDWLANWQKKKVFVDLKFHDIPRTVGAAVANLSKHGATLTTIHCAQKAMVEEAAAAKGGMKLLGVTVLTSMTPADLADVGYTGTIAELASTRAKAAMAAGCDGLVCSGLEAAALRAAVGNTALLVTPGIRPSGKPEADQQRVADVATALKNGADYLVVGRPIIAAESPAKAAAEIQAQIAQSLAK